ncbi:MAG: molybdopterin-dependent oxidoreductase [Nitrospinae bacterium]|nr:molybdopterin-dependent oxidoreductase [Nitrospinota bacterium]
MAEKETVTLTVDGIEVTVEKGAKVYDACVAAGVYLPGLCYDPKLSHFGGCRMCIVDIVNSRGRKSSKWACCEPATKGYAVTTTNAKIDKKRQIMMEFLLMHHPLDCPTCNASGDCGLQDAAFFVKQKKGRLPQTRRNEPLLIDNPVLERDFNKCILCGKCVLACNELQGNGAIDFQRRGFWAEVGTPYRIPLNCDFCGQCLAVCPTGSFQDHTEEYKGHDWEYAKTVTTCPFCGVGCSLVLNEKKGDIAKVTSDDHIGVNNGNLCARGRFGHEAYQADGRIETPLIRDGVRLLPATWEKALDTAAARLKEIVAQHGADSVALVGGEQLTNEDAYLLQRLAREGIKTPRIETLANLRAPRLHARLFDEFGADAPLTPYAAFEEAGAIVFLGADPEKENPVVGNMVRMIMRDNKTPLYIAHSRNTLFSPVEKAAARYRYGAETAFVAALTGAVKSGKADAALSAAHGVAVATVETIAAGIAGKSPVIVMGAEVADHPMGADIVAAVVALAKAAGGKSLLLREYANTQGTNDMGLSTSHRPGYAKAEGAADGADLFRLMADGKVKALVVAGADPVVQHADGAYVAEAIKGNLFTLVTTSYRSETALLADVVLPSCTPPEREGSYTNNEGRVQAVRQALAPFGEAKADWEIFAALGARLGMKSAYGDAARITAEIAATVPGYEGLTGERIAQGDALVAYPKGEAKTVSFTTEPLKIPAVESFRYLAHFGNSLYHLGSLSRASATLNKIDGRTWVEINPDDAAKDGLDEGEDVTLESKQGSIRAVVRVSDRSPAGTVFIPKNFENEPALKLVYRSDDVTRIRIAKSPA